MGDKEGAKPNDSLVVWHLPDSVEWLPQRRNLDQPFELTAIPDYEGDRGICGSLAISFSAQRDLIVYRGTQNLHQNQRWPRG